MRSFEIFENLLLQELRIKYRRTYLGYLWSLINPLLHLLVISFVFSHIVQLGVKDYTLYLFSGIFVWTFFQGSVFQSSTSILENESFIKKIYVPKFLFPLSKTAFNFINFLVAFTALLILGYVMHFPMHSTLLLVPIACLPLFIFTLGCSYFLATLTVYFRDLQQMLGVFLQLIYFATPIMYPISRLPDNYQLLAELNPLYIELKLFHSLIYFGKIPTAPEWGLAVAVAIASLVIGVACLKLNEDKLVLNL